MLDIRPETPQDAAIIRNLNLEAFEDSTEADLVDKLRSRQGYTLSLVATDEDKILGHILFSPVSIESPDGSFGALGLGPMAVLPPQQGKGVGSQMVTAGLRECWRTGHKIVLVLGHADYYPRFGFVPASRYGIKSEYDGVPDEAFMVLELESGTLAGRGGVVKYQPEFSEGP